MELNVYQIGPVTNGYLTVAVLVALALGIALGILVLTHLLGPRRRGAIKQGTYESGMEPIGDTRRRFNVRFYLVAVLFLVFDVEIVFLYPWAVLYPQLQAPPGSAQASWAQAMAAAGFTPWFMLAALGLFFILLLVGLIYEWRRGVFNWN